MWCAGMLAVSGDSGLVWSYTRHGAVIRLKDPSASPGGTAEGVRRDRTDRCAEAHEACVWRVDVPSEASSGI